MQYMNDCPVHKYKECEAKDFVPRSSMDSNEIEDVARATRPKLPYRAEAKDVTAKVDNLNIRPASHQGRNPPSTGPESTQEANNTIIVFDRTLKHLQSYDPEKKRWKQIQAMNDDMVGDKWFTAVVLHPHIYVMLRNKAVYRVDHAKLNSGRSATWERMADKSLQSISAAMLNGFIYAAEYIDGRVENYNPVVNEWVEVGSEMRRLPSSTALVSARGNLYCIGGVGISTTLRKVEKFNPTTSTWSNVQPMNQARCNAAAVEFDGKIYVMGGYDNAKLLNSVECYDIDLDSWTMVASMKVARSDFSACVIAGKIFVVGGDKRDPFRSTQTIEMFDLKKNEWKIVERMEGKDVALRASVAVSSHH